MPHYQYAIGSTNPPTNVESLSTPLNPPRGEMVEWSRTYDRANGLVGADGFPVARWKFDVLTQAMVDQLRSFCPGKSSEVYITTLKPDDTYGTYTAVMVWDDAQLKKRNFGGRYLGIEIEFRRLEAV